MNFEFLGYATKLLFSKLPGWLIRLYYNSDKICGSIDIDLRSNSPIDIRFGTEIPEINLYFHINNRSPFDLTLDRLLIDLWVAQPTLKGVILRRHFISRGKSSNDICFSCPLTSQQQNQIKKRCEESLISVPIKISITAYLESKVGMICCDRQIERSDVPCK